MSGGEQVNKAWRGSDEEALGDRSLEKKKAVEEASFKFAVSQLEIGARAPFIGLPIPRVKKKEKKSRP